MQLVLAAVRPGLPRPETPANLRRNRTLASAILLPNTIQVFDPVSVFSFVSFPTMEPMACGASTLSNEKRIRTEFD